MLIFDIETEPLSRQQLREILPPWGFGVSPPSPFDPGSVKTGNMKDEKKIAEKIEAARKAHQAEVDGHAAKMKEDEQRYWDVAYQKAALSAETGAVCAIGYRNDKGTVVIDHIIDTPEVVILSRFWEKFSGCRISNRSMIGFNCNRFDVPFLARRSWIQGVPVPDGLFTPTGYLCHLFVDLMLRWQCGDRQASISLDRACRAMGIPGKPDDCTGEQFHQMLRLEGGHEAALRYLENDLAMTFSLAQRLGVL